jgi:hypothetical protein
MKTCLFVGPTLSGETIASGIQRFGPVAMGSVFRAVEAGYLRIGIVDGYFGNVPSVWHKEILFALSLGVEVSGAASLGALRAAELYPFGMVGIGCIYRLFRRGIWTDDDEVAIIHAPDRMAFQPLSLAMANIRFTLRRLQRLRVLDETLAKALAQHMKNLHFSERSSDQLRQHAASLVGHADAEQLAHAFAREYVDLKMVDARTLVRWLVQERPPSRTQREWQFPATGHWKMQFDYENADVPRLE